MQHLKLEVQLRDERMSVAESTLEYGEARFLVVQPLIEPVERDATAQLCAQLAGLRDLVGGAACDDVVGITGEAQR